MHAVHRSTYVPLKSSVHLSRRTIKSHSRAPGDSLRDGDAQEWRKERFAAASPAWDPRFTLSSPRQLAEHLDAFVVGQERAKKVLSVAVFNHYNRIRAKLQARADAEALYTRSRPSEYEESELENHNEYDERTNEPSDIRPHPTRRPKPRSLKDLHPFASLPHLSVPAFEKSNVLLMGPTGSGKTLLARTLARVLDVPFAMSDATTLTQAGYVGEDVEQVIFRLLQASNWDVERASVGIVVLDEADKLARRSGASESSRDVSGEGVQQGLLRMLEGSVINISAKGAIEGTGGPDLNGPDDPSRGRQGPPISSAPKAETYQVDTTDILFVLSGAFVGLDKIVEQRMNKGSIGFGAPIASSSLSKDVKPSLPFFTRNTEPRETNHYDLVEPTDLVKYGFIPEFTSRIPTITALNPLTPSDLLRVLTEVRGALTKQYEALFGYSGVDIRFSTPALREICIKAIERGMGARGLRGVMETLLLDAMYDVPGSSVRYVLIDRSVVLGERPAHYWSRGEGSAFYSALAAEEALDAKAQWVADAQPADDTDNQLQREVKAREEERSSRAKTRARRSTGGGIP